MTSRVGTWAAMAHATDPTSPTIGSGSNRMLVYLTLVERAGDYTVTTFTIGGQTFDYTSSVFIDSGTQDQIIKAFIWNESTITAMSGTAVSYVDGISNTDLSWSYGTFQDADQVAPTITTGGAAATQSFDLTTTSISDDVVIAGLTSDSANRVPLTADTLTSREAYSVANVAHAIFDGVGGDNTTTLASDLVANSAMAGMCIVLANATSSAMMMRMMQENG